MSLDADKLAELLTDCGLEVEGIEQSGAVVGGLEGLVVGEIKSVAKHSNADKLSVTSVDVGDGKDLTIVCGAPNVKEGQKVIVARVGVTIYPIKGENFEIKNANIRGEDSEGMICAEDEIGLGHEHDGIIELDASANVGDAVKNYYNMEVDTIFDIGLTPNRIDAASHIGVARDIKAVLKARYEEEAVVKMPSVENFVVYNDSSSITVEVEDQAACPRYAGVSISGITVGDSPEWIRNRIKSIGISPINNIVDITNYVLHELGQPLHAFDADKISGGKVIIKKLNEGTKFTTLDDVERKLSGSDLMICDENGGMCLAGVFGGNNSGVSESTKNIFLESAYFDPITIRKAAKRHELNTDASFRFERGADPNMTILALKRAALLIKEIAGGEISSEVIDIYPEKIRYFRVNFSYSNCNKLIGKELDQDLIKRILTSLDIEVEDESEDGLKLSIPPYRADVTREVDVIEEVLRIYGYNNVEDSTSMSYGVSASDAEVDNSKETIAELLTGSGFNEIMLNSISHSSYYSGTEEVAILNPLNADLDVLRSNLLYGALEVVERNQNHQRPDLKLYEFGKSYEKKSVDGDDSGQYHERQLLGITLSGKLEAESWQADEGKANYYVLKGAVMQIFDRLGISKPGVQEEDHDAHSLQGQSIFILKKHIATLGAVKKSVLKKFGIKSPVYYAEINWDQVQSLLKVNKIRHKELARFPEVRRDLALLLDKNTRYDSLRELAVKTEKKILKSVNIFDVYEGDKIGEGKKSYALGFTFQDDSKTLTDKEIDSVMENLKSAYKSEFGAEIR